jgi:hypothetical protein
MWLLVAMVMAAVLPFAIIKAMLTEPMRSIFYGP